MARTDAHIATAPARRQASTKAAGRQQRRRGGVGDEGSGGSVDARATSCAPQAQTQITMQPRTHKEACTPVSGGHVFERGRAHARGARRRSSRRRWLPAGRSGPRAPRGVGRGSGGNNRLLNTAQACRKQCKDHTPASVEPAAERECATARLCFPP